MHKFNFLLPFLVFILIFIAAVPAVAQELTVRDRTDMSAVPGVVIFNSDSSLSAFTDLDGRADVSAFSESDTLIFSHLAYNVFKISKKNASAKSYLILLDANSMTLDEIVLSANYGGDNISEIAGKTLINTRRQIAFSAPQSAADILASEGKVFVQKSQAGGGSPVIRGFEANRILLVIDGVRMNNAIYRSGHLQNSITLDPNILERTEVLFGPSSVMYGSDALGGSVHFYTRDPKLSGRQDFRFSGGGFLRAGSVDNERSGQFYLEAGGKKWAWLGSLTHKNIGDLRAGSTGNPADRELWSRDFYAGRLNGKDSLFANPDPLVQKFSGYSQTDLLQKVVFQPHANNRYTFNFQYSESSEIPRYDRLAQRQGEGLQYSEWSYGPQKRLFGVIRADFTDGANLSRFYDDAGVSVAFQDIEESRISRDFGSEFRKVRTENVKVYSANIDLVRNFTHDKKLRYGLEINYNKVNSSAYSEPADGGERQPADSRYPDGGSEMQTFAAYMAFVRNFRDEAGEDKLVLSAGLRYNYVTLRSLFTDKTFFPLPFEQADLYNKALNGSLGSVWHIGPEHRFSLNLSTGFRVPNVDDVGKVFDSQPGSVIVPNAALKAERSYTIDAVWEKQFGENLIIEFNAWLTYFERAIVRAPFLFDGKDSVQYDGRLSAVWSNVNAENARMHGFYAAARWKINKNWNFRTNVNFTGGRLQNPDRPAGHIPPTFGQSSLTYKTKGFKAEFFVDYHAQKPIAEYGSGGEDKPIAATPEGMPAWHTFNLRASKNLSRNIKIRLNALNLADRHYRQFAAGISAPGRNFILTLAADF